MNNCSPDTQRMRRTSAWRTDGDDSRGAGAIRAKCGHCNLTMLRPHTHTGIVCLYVCVCIE